VGSCIVLFTQKRPKRTSFGPLVCFSVCI
jgi:hypothetical protein